MLEEVFGVRVVGQSRGRKIGFPTLNIAYNGAFRGVFAGMVQVRGLWYCAAINVGGRPTFLDEEVFLEAHLLDFSEEVLPGELIKVRINQKIRDVNKFPSLAALVEQITEDIKAVRNWCAR